MATLTVFASASGRVGRQGVDVTWANMISGGGNEAATTDTVSIFIRSSATSNQFAFNRRSIYMFDTSALKAGSVVNSATLSIASRDVGAGDSKADGSNAPNLTLVAATPASNTVLVDGDYSQIGTTELCSARITYANWSTTDGTYNDFTLNASGLANISKTGYSNFAAINGQYDFDAVQPTWVANNNQCYLRGYFVADGGATIPKLVIDYTPASSGFFALLL